MYLDSDGSAMGNGTMLIVGYFPGCYAMVISNFISVYPVPLVDVRG